MKQDGPNPERPWRAVIIHSYADGIEVLGQARLVSARLLLLSAPSAGCALGPAWWLALTASLDKVKRSVELRDLLDCGASAGRAMEALRLGVRDLVLSERCLQQATVRVRAAALGGTVLGQPPTALDVASKHGFRQLRRWLEAQ